MKNSSIVLFLLSLLFSVLLFSGCKRTFVRPPELLDLGEVRTLLEPKTHVQDKMILVTFDEEKGWAAMSTRCTRDGCDLSFLDDYLYNPCSRTIYSHAGKLLYGESPAPLPYYRVRYSDGHLFVDTAQEVDSSYRFMTKELKAMLPIFRKRNKVDGVGDMPRVPRVLQGYEPKGSGRMFTDDENIEDF